MTVKTRAQIAQEFNWCAKTFRAKLRSYGIVLPSGGIDPRWQKLIYETFWYPEGTSEKAYYKYRLPEGWED